MVRIVAQARVEEIISLIWTGAGDEYAVRLFFGVPSQIPSDIEQEKRFRSGLFYVSGEQASQLAVGKPARVIIEQD